MKTYYDQETACELQFRELGPCYHLWTPENFSIIFASHLDFSLGMSLMGLCSFLFPNVKILTFELMTNHMHVVASGPLEDFLALFNRFKTALRSSKICEERAIDWRGFNPNTRLIETLRDLRNVIVYCNRNGFVVNPEYSPYSYPWGANRYYFSSDSCRFALQNARRMTIRERREMSHSREFDFIDELMVFDGCALPLSFCCVDAGESMFRNASHYFSVLSKNIESNKMIAKDIGESVFCNDDEIYSVIYRESLEKCGAKAPSLAPALLKIELAKKMRYEYNSSRKQIMRILKIDANILDSLGIK